jgi:hypothetical protein
MKTSAFVIAALVASTSAINLKYSKNELMNMQQVEMEKKELE